ncbi:DUF389 domain-containing protein [Massilia forsythiae]|uniref:DUF389 domain-containing protein n=1 Tax=Massilia forsythiae TaxID=2728020 RepID=A0A7Z2W117_9BURK|nr:DUF389 domain-containing protein [Massilia forsythiae]QJE02465.1 DUF389 domain-containing protein [Massilia forsythiae]
MERLKKLFDLRHDQDENSVIDSSIRSGERIVGTNLWVLIFAILIASVGLNVNSTAVVIGAMLISPLMGPLLAIGYGAGISDYRLIRTAARSLLVFAALSVLTSTLYFLLSPLSQAQTELMARTTPTLWDVLIAFFGGCAGIVAQTRRGASTIVPGAAIATALMPPLCTAGYGIAAGNWHFVGGALYLFLINAFFITLATYLFVTLIGLPQHESGNPRLQRRAHILIVLGVLALGVPSAWLAYGLVQDQLFLAASKDVSAALDREPNAVVLRRDVDMARRTMAVTLGGERIAPATEAVLEKRLQANGVRQARLVLRHVGAEKVDVTTLRNELRSELMANVDGQVQQRTVALDAMHLQITKAEREQAERTALIPQLLAEYRTITRVSVAQGLRMARGDTAPAAVMVLTLEAQPRLREEDLERIRAGLAVRFAANPVEVVQALPASAKRRRKGRP